ncbi:hypothetical protein D3C71_314620 [compost metagenome]
MTTEAFLIGLLGMALGAVFKFGLDVTLQRVGWGREDRRDNDRKIERVDQHARDNIARVERELKEQLNDQGHKLTRLQEQVRHLPTADDIEEVRAGVARVDASLSAVTAKVEGTSEMVRTIRDHILKVER